MLRRGLTEQTAEKYASVVRSFAGGAHAPPVLEATSEDVVLWLHDRTHQLSPRTRHVYLTSLHAFFTWAADERLIHYPPTARVLKPRSRTAGLPVDADVLVDAELFRDFRRAQERRNLSPRTIDERSGRLRSFAVWMRPRSVLDATCEDVESWLDSCRIGGRSRGMYMSALSVFFAFARREGRVESNVLDDMLRPRKGRLVPRPIAEDDLVRAIRQAPPRMAAWLSLAAYMGLRCKEIAGLRRDDLLLDRPVPVLIVSHPKGGRERVLPVNVHVDEALRRYGLPLHGFVFESERGMPFSPATVSGYIAGYLHDLGISATAHQARHLFATTIYNATKDIRVAQEMLGHADCSTTAIYVAMNPDTAAAAMRGLTYGAGE